MNTVVNTTINDLERVFQKQKVKAIEWRTSTAKERIHRLKKLQRYMLSHQKEIEQALHIDLRKHEVEAVMTEIYVANKEIKECIKHLKGWMKPKYVSTPLPLFTTSGKVVYEPKGVSLIIAPWNYPFFLQMGPFVNAIAAGNTAILKPSEMTPHVSSIVKKIISEVFEEEEAYVAEGGVEVSTALLEMPFDHIYFTGSPQVGKIIMNAAAKNLSSVTLELGGKSPVVVDKKVNQKDAAKKIIWGKLTNMGQTCVAPDYLLVHEEIEKEFLDALQESMQKMYNADGKGIQQAEALSRIVNERHFDRIVGIIEDAIVKGAEVVCGGTWDRDDLYIAPTILRNVTEDMKVMQEEIFGPLLPVNTYKTLEEAIEIVDRREKPLAYYIFSKSRRAQKYLLNHSTAGSTAINETILQVAHPHLPFGGVNNSGIGKANGYYSFLEFSNQRSVLKQKVGLTNMSMLYPPYTPFSATMINTLKKWF
ncbi:aldehyde dehydrogenase family protein [Algivirga pacifica]|uniref:Aldehyde dehydrogenase n=1 Tax=Algivirga pacifica TaxID=1162670 RepID=A0ABP9DC78_9BACT